jgi:mono/diheme cytochrome c family protein
MLKGRGWLSAVALLATTARGQPSAALQTMPSAASTPTFNRDIALVLFQHCAMCHHPGEVAPFPLLSYEDAKRRARQIVQVTESHRMPPWQPEPGYGDFSNDRRLTEKEIRTIAEWAARGAPQGDPKDLPPAPQFVDGWQLGKPDLILTMSRALDVPANSSETYRCFVLPTGLTSEGYLRAVELRPGTSGVVHHAIVVQDPHRAGRRLEKSAGEGYPCGGGFGFAMPGMLTMWTAGTVAHEDPEGIATVLQRNSDVVVQLHLRPQKQDGQVQASIGLYFAKQAPRRTPLDLSVTSYDVDIPAGKRDLRVTGFSYVPNDVDALSIFAHAHFLATGFKVTATLPDGEVKRLLLIRHWNFDWQENYWFESPLRLPAGTRLDMEVTYDNSESNPRNPNSPPKRVTWGFLATDEMCEVHLRGVAVDVDVHPMPPEHVH